MRWFVLVPLTKEDSTDVSNDGAVDSAVAIAGFDALVLSVDSAVVSAGFDACVVSVPFAAALEDNSCPVLVVEIWSFAGIKTGSSERFRDLKEGWR